MRLRTAYQNVDELARAVAAIINGNQLAGSLVYDTGYITTPVQTLTISDLNSDEVGGYEYAAEFYNSAGSVSNISLYVNGDTTATNYQKTGIYGGFSAATAYNLNDALLIGLANGGHGESIGTIRRIVNGTQIRISTTSGKKEDGLLWMQQIWKTAGSIDNINSITFKSNVANGIGINSRVRLWRKA